MQGTKRNRSTFVAALAVLAMFWTAGTVSAQPVNNDICGAITVQCGTIANGDTTHAPGAPGAACGPAPVPPTGTVYYRLVGNGDTFTVSTCNPGTFISTSICVFGELSDQGCTMVEPIGQNVGACGMGSTVNFLTDIDREYFIRVDTLQDVDGYFELTVDSTSACNPPTSGPEFIRGDSNLDGQINIGDPVSALAVLFSGGSTTCVAASDANDDGRDRKSTRLNSSHR